MTYADNCMFHLIVLMSWSRWQKMNHTGSNQVQFLQTITFSDFLPLLTLGVDIQSVLPLSDARAARLLLSPASRNSTLASINCQLYLQSDFKEATQSPIVHGNR